MLLHPPFKPKRLIHLCPDGTIQVLSAVDEDSKGNHINTQQQYQLNYSNSAIRPSIEHCPTFPSMFSRSSKLSFPNDILDESSLAIAGMRTNLNHMLITESTSTEQSQSTKEILFDRLIVDNNSILSIQQKKTLCEYRSPSRLAMYEKTITPNRNENPIVEIDLDLNDETIDEKCEDDQNSLPEIVFKRIVVPERKYLSIA